MVNVLGERRCARSKNSSSEVVDESEETGLELLQTRELVK